MPTHHWTPLTHHSEQDSYHQFTQVLDVDSQKPVFAFLAEALPTVSSNNQTSRSEIGAQLALKAAKTAINELTNRTLSFNENFWIIFSQHWKAKIFLHAIEHPTSQKKPYSIDTLGNTEALNHEQKSVLKKYDASLSFCFIDKNKATLFQTGAIKIALLNRRYHCEIKTPELPSSIALMYNTYSPNFEYIDINTYRLEMPLLLSHQYSNKKSEARLTANIFKIYRSMGTGNVSNPLVNGANLIAFKSDQESLEEPKVPSSSLPKKNISTTKKTLALRASLMTALVGIGSYYLWPVQNIEAGPKAHIAHEIKPLTQTPPPSLVIKTQKKQEQEKKFIPLKTEKVLADTGNHQLTQQRAADALIIKKEKQPSTDPQEKKQPQEQQRHTEAETKQLDIQETANQRQLVELSALHKKKHIEETNAKTVVKIQRQESEKQSIKRDLEIISLHQAQRRNQQQNTEQKRKISNNSMPLGRQEQQLKTQQYIKIKTEEKRQLMEAELKKQQKNNENAKNARQQASQNTMVHQLVSYRKIFSQHTKQLNQKTDTLQKLATQTNANILISIRKKELLERKKADILQRLDFLSQRYADKLKRICEKNQIYPVVISLSATPTERTALLAISHHLKNCRNPHAISAKTIKKTLLKAFSAH